MATLLNEFYRILFEQNRNEATIRKFIDEHPNVCCMQDKQYKYPIQIAIEEDCSWDLISRMLDLCELHPYKKPKNQSVDRFIANILFQAKLEAISVDVLTQLVHKYLYLAQLKDNNDNYLIHRICKKWDVASNVISTLANINRESCMKRNMSGNLPLHLLLGNYQSDASIACILDKYPDAVHTWNEDGYLPIHMACKTQLFNTGLIARMIEACPGYCSVPTKKGHELPLHIALSTMRGIQQPMSLFNYKQTIHYLIDKYPDATKQRRKNYEYPLHIICGHGSYLDVIMKIYDIYPEVIRKANLFKNLPLHIAVGDYSCNADVVSYLLDKHPKAIDHRNSNGDLAIHIVCKGLTFPQPSSMFPYMAPLPYPCKLDIIKKLAEAKPEHCRVAKKGEKLPLHMILSNQYSSVEATVYLIEQYPGAVSLKLQNHDYPIHIECQGKCRLEVIMRLVDTFPESCGKANQAGYLPLHLAINNKDQNEEAIGYLINRYPAALDVANEDNLLPIHLVCKRGNPPVTPGILKKLLEARPAHLMTPMHNQPIPLHTIIQPYNTNNTLDNILNLIDAYPDATRIKFPMDGQQESYCIHMECQYHCRLEVIMRIVEVHLQCCSVLDDYGCYPLHYAVECFQCSFLVMRYLINQCPEAVQHENNDGNLPIHILLRSYNLTNVIILYDKLALLVSLYPQSCGTMDSYDMLPLERACENFCRDKDIKPIQILLQHYPAALHHVNPHSECIPFHGIIYKITASRALPDIWTLYKPVIILFLQHHPQALLLPIDRPVLENDKVASCSSFHRFLLNSCLSVLSKPSHINNYHDMNWMPRSPVMYLLLQLSTMHVAYDHLDAGKRVCKRMPSSRRFIIDESQAYLRQLLLHMISLAGDMVPESTTAHPHASRYGYLKGNDIGKHLLRSIVLCL